MLFAPTGVSAINIDGTTIPCGLNIPCHGKKFCLSKENRTLLRNKYYEVQLIIIIDEITMVPSELHFHVHQRLIEIFESPSKILFARKFVILCGDLYQIRPVRAKPVFMFDEYSLLLQGVVSVNLWRNFKLAELAEVLCQKDNVDFIHWLNKVLVGNIDNNVENIPKTRFISKNNPLYPTKALQIFAENRPARFPN